MYENERKGINKYLNKRNENESWKEINKRQKESNKHNHKLK